MAWKKFVEIWDEDAENISIITEAEMLQKFSVYKNSINISDRCCCFIARDSKEKFLVITRGSDFDEFDGEILKVCEKIVKKCPLSISNSEVIRRIFNFTNPVSVGERPVSIGLGDRLGRASAGHLKLLKGTGIFPVLAQQSIRELNLTGRTYDDVLAAAVWAVFQEGYKGGYGADGDHLKTPEEVIMALGCGFTMITLDCSEYINNDLDFPQGKRIGGAYTGQEYWEDKYLNKTFKIGETNISINKNELADTVLIYRGAINFAEKIYKEIISKWENRVDFEISIDETLKPTDVKSHYIIASELKSRGIEVKNIAPRFCGEFQKGIDYKGDIDRFSEELILHNAIAQHFGYRLSIHSGSDKFSVFPIIGDLTDGRFHVKTAGTNWLEAMRVVAIEDAVLFRQMYRHAAKKLDEAKVFYHISTEKSMLPDDNKYTDIQLLNLLDEEASRQALHITYGYLLGDKDENNRYLFREKFFEVLHKYESTYYECLEKHIGRHINALGIG